MWFHGTRVNNLPCYHGGVQISEINDDSVAIVICITKLLLYNEIHADWPESARLPKTYPEFYVTIKCVFFMSKIALIHCLNKKGIVSIYTFMDANIVWILCHVLSTQLCRLLSWAECFLRVINVGRALNVFHVRPFIYRQYSSF